MIRKVVVVTVTISLMVLFPALSRGIDFGEQEKNREQHFKEVFYFAEVNLYDAPIILMEKEKINLTGEQERKVEKLMLDYQERSIREGAEIKIEELRLVSYLNSDKPNRKEMVRRIRKISEKKTDMLVGHMNYLLDLKEVLTLKQLQLLVELKEQKKTELRKFLKKRAMEMPPPEKEEQEDYQEF